MKPGLYIVGTPIGNLDDVSIRSQNVLNSVDQIICENPKHSIKLLSKFGIKKKMYSLHDHNEDEIIKKIGNIATSSRIALISDAGSPLISDPGFKLVRFYIENKINISVVPGPSAIISALQLSGMPAHSFKFLGFLPKNKKGILDFIKNIENEDLTSVFFVSTHRVKICIETISKYLADREISICKELTKLNEKVFRGSPKNIILEFEKDKKNNLGEFVFLVSGKNKENDYKKLSDELLDKQIGKLLNKFSLTDVVEIVHKLTNISKKIIYKKVLDQKK